MTRPPPLSTSEDYDAGDHVNLTADAYNAIAGGIDLTTLGPDN
jgi:hypothetical protein